MAFIGIGDSIMRGYNSTLNGVPALSWGQWLSEANGWPSLIQAKGGYTTPQIIEHIAADAEGEWDVVGVSAGTNDVLRPTWEPDRFVANHSTLISVLSNLGTHLLVLNIPAQLGGKQAGLVAEANAIIAETTKRYGGILVDVSDLSGNVLMRPDLIHPSAVGHHEIANRAADALTTAGFPAKGADTLGIGSPNAKLGATDALLYSSRYAKLQTKAAIKRALGR